MYINKAFVFGNLTRDPEMRALPSGVKVAQLSVATNRTWKDKNGVKQESVDFHNVVAFGVQADLISQYMRKGSSIFVEGRIQNRSWDAQDGTKKYRSEIIIENFQFGPKPGGVGGGYSGTGSQSSGSTGSTGGKSTTPQAPELDTIEYPEEDIKPEDIPF